MKTTIQGLQTALQTKNAFSSHKQTWDHRHYRCSAYIDRNTVFPENVNSERGKKEQEKERCRLFKHDKISNMRYEICSFSSNDGSKTN